MTRRISATILTVSFLATASISAQMSRGDEAWSTLAVQGVQQGEGAYKLALEYHPAGEAPLTAGIIVWSEPSHTPVLVHWNSLAGEEVIKNFVAGEEPLAEASGEFGKSHPRVVVPFTAGGDRMVVAELLQPDGKRHIVLGALVDLKSFAVKTSFIQTQEGDTGPFRHCCSGPICTQLCIDCDGPYFTCNLVECTIECDNDSSGGFPRE